MAAEVGCQRREWPLQRPIVAGGNNDSGAISPTLTSRCTGAFQATDLDRGAYAKLTIFPACAGGLMAKYASAWALVARAR